MTIKGNGTGTKTVSPLKACCNRLLFKVGGNIVQIGNIPKMCTEINNPICLNGLEMWPVFTVNIVHFKHNINVANIIINSSCKVIHVHRVSYK